MTTLRRSRPGAALLALLAAGTPLAARGPDAWQLYHALVQRGQLELRLPAGPLAERCRQAARLLRARTGLEVVLLAPDERTDPGRPRVVLGTWDWPDVAPVARALGIERREEGGFEFGGHVYSNDGDGLVAWFADPERPGLPVALYFAEREQDLIPLVTDLMPPSGPSVVCWRGGTAVYEASLTASGGLLPQTEVSTWQLWPRFHEGAADVREERLQSLVSPEVDPERHADYLRRLLAARARAAEWLGLARSELGTRLRVHGHLQEMVELSRASALAVANVERPGAEVLLAPGVPDDGGAAAVEGIARHLLGPPAEPWLAGALGVAAAGSWWGRDLEEQLGRLAAAGPVPSPAELVDPALDIERSPHLVEPLRALLFELLLERERERARQPDGAARGLWTGERALEIDGELAAVYRERLERAAATISRPAHAAVDGPFRAGVSLEPAVDYEGRDPTHPPGYGTRGSDLVLGRARDLGANAVALSTRAFMDPDWPRVPDPPLALRGRATESDAAIAFAAGHARELSMRVLLQPHLLTSPSGVLAGRHAWTGTGAQERLLVEYEHFIEHYALLADLLDLDVLCFGTELDAAMDFVPDPRRKNVDLSKLAAKRERWIGVVERARACYGGALTYAVRSSNDASAVDDFELWEHFDLVAASLFQPVQHPTWRRPMDVEQLERQIDALTEAARRAGRPLLVLSAGFPSSPRAAYEPRVPGRPSRTAFVQRQGELFRALAEVVGRAREAGDLAGLYLWCLSTDPLREGPTDSGYTPLGKPAERWLPLLFGR